MKLNKIILIISLSILMILAIQSVNATTYTDNFNNLSGWTSITGETASGGTCNLVNSGQMRTTFAPMLTNGYFDVEFDYKPTSTNTAVYCYIGAGNTIWTALYLHSDTSVISLTDNSNHNDVSYTFTTNTLYHVRYYGDVTGQHYILSVGGNTVSSGNRASLPSTTQTCAVKFASFNTANIYNFYYDTTSGAQPPATSYTLFTGTVKDSNGNPLQYANVTLWSVTGGSSVINTTLTNSTGYYNLYNTTSNGFNYSLTVQPANQGYTNAIQITDNSSITTYTNNFIVNPITLTTQIVDADNINKQITNTNIQFTKYGSGWNSANNYINVANPWTYNGTLNISDNIYINISANGYFNKSYASNWLVTNNVIYIGLNENNTYGNYVLIHGFTRDNQGYKVTNVSCYLLDNNNNVVDSTISNSVDGQYGLKLPKTNGITYTVVVNWPTYGNMTATLYNTGSQTQIGQSFKYPNTWNDLSWDANQNLGIDLWLNIGKNDYPTPTPSGNPSVNPSVNPVNGYYTIVVATVDNNYNAISNIPVVLQYPNTSIFTSVNTNNGLAYIYVPTTSAIGTFKLIAYSTSSYSNTSTGFSSKWVDFYSSNPVMYTTLQLSSINMQYEIYGYVTDSTDYTNIGGAYMTIANPSHNVILSTYSQPSYKFYLDNNLPIGHYYLNITANGYQNAYYGFDYPDYFIQYGNNVRNDFPMYKTYTSNAVLLTVKVFGSHSGLPINGAYIDIDYANNTKVNSAFTDNNGNAQAYLYNGDYILRISANGYTSQSYTTTINSVNNLNPVMTITLDEKTTVTPNPSISINPTVTTNPSGDNPSLPTFNIIQFIESYIRSFGISEQNVKPVLGLIIIIVLAVIGAGIGMKAGSGMGSIIAVLCFCGFVFDCIVGLFPIMYLLLGILAGIIAVLFLKSGATQ